MSAGPFETWFSEITGHPLPHPWQTRLAAESLCRNRLIRVPTGLGKTEGVMAAWSVHPFDRVKLCENAKGGDRPRPLSHTGARLLPESRNPTPTTLRDARHFESYRVAESLCVFGVMA